MQTDTAELKPNQICNAIWVKRSNWRHLWHFRAWLINMNRLLKTSFTYRRAHSLVPCLLKSFVIRREPYQCQLKFTPHKPWIKEWNFDVASLYICKTLIRQTQVKLAHIYCLLIPSLDSGWHNYGIISAFRTTLLHRLASWLLQDVFGISNTLIKPLYPKRLFF